MTLDAFVTKYNGRFIDFDGAYGFQCVDLMRQWQVEGLGVPASSIPPSLYAKDIFKNFPDGGNKYFTKIKNGPNNMPQKGDIVFWTWYPFKIGWAGHVAIASVSWLLGLNTFDQNFPLGSFCKFTLHDYKGCLGWLHSR